MDDSLIARLGATLGLIAVLGNVLGVIVLRPIPDAYRAGSIAEWARQTLAAPVAASTSGVAFTIGVIALAGWALVLGWRLGTPVAVAAGGAVAIGALLNAAGTLAPVVVAWHLPRACASPEACLPAAVSLLGMSLSLDALFNLLLGIGLIGLAVAAGEWPMALRLLTGLAGLASLPVSLQFYSDAAARLLAIAGPLWLAAVLVASLLLWRGRI